MKKLLVIILSIFMFNSFASNQDIQILMNDYLMAFKNHDEDKIKKLSTDKYYKMLKKTSIIELAFSKKNTHTKDKASFDFKVKEGARDKEMLFVNIKDKNDLEYGEYWYVLKKEKDKYKIDDMITFD